MRGQLLIICRLAARDIRQRKVETALLLLALITATTTLTLGLGLRGVTSGPYARTRALTTGPDVVATYAGQRAERAALELSQVSGITGGSGPYPVAYAVLRARGHATPVQVEGRGQGLAAVDQPYLTQGTWVRAGGVVLERAYAEALGLVAGDRVTLNGKPYTVDGIAVSAAVPAYPQVCFLLSCNDPAPAEYGISDMGMAWASRSTAGSLATRSAPLTYVLELRLHDPATAGSFAAAHGSGALAGAVASWQQISAAGSQLVLAEQQVLAPGSLLAMLLALASATVLAGGRMAAQGRRAGLLKAAGGTPVFVAAVLLAENLALAAVAAAAGLAVGWLISPLLASPGAGLLSAGEPALQPSAVGLVCATALGIALLATIIPAIRAARRSTVAALADAALRPSRRGWLITISSRLPVPVLFGVRLIARRPRRAVLSAATIAVTVTGIVAVLTNNATIAAHNGGWSSGLTDPITARVNQMIVVLTGALVLLAAVNAIFITWATVLDARRPAALARSLGASPRQVTAGLSAAQVIPSLPAAVIGIPLGVALFAVVANGAHPVLPSPAWLALVVLGTMAVVAGLTAVPARIGALRPAAEVLSQET